MSNFDVVIVGAGPVALKAAQLILKRTRSVAIIKEPNQWDSYYYRYLNDLAGTTSTPTADSLQQPITIIDGPCRFSAPSTLETENGSLSAQKILLATGFEPRQLPMSPNSLPPIYPWDIPTLTPIKSPHVTIIGGGPIGVSAAFHLIHNSIKPTIMTKGSRILSDQEPEIGQFIHDQLLALGATIVYDKKIDQADFNESWISAIGIQPLSQNLNLSVANVFTDPQGIVLTTDDLMTSAQKQVWAMGTIRSGTYRLNDEQEDAEIAANNVFENLFNIQRKSSDPLPYVIPTTPPIASIGLTESQALEKKLSIKTSVTSWNTPEKGLVKLVAKKRSGHLLGAHLIGNRSAEMMSFFSLVMRAGIPLMDIIEPYHHAELSFAPHIGKSIKQWVTGS